ncbi:hypothetical protein [Paracoccus fistulariae]|uniref:Uncharacterized protein n=1 Tax=Paracoccus fistulariae TaxID=658446 RepID=A0ABY7SHS1_9RHOB|nr:hypothetical protein [Paracoccus fistulariae]MDB6183280.1 hypothetical protein [Paracoccus fistulariae]WCR06556.1 hypothetical protein JHX87_13860 [Paracoccus fistulariae]
MSVTEITVKFRGVDCTALLIFSDPNTPQDVVPRVFEIGAEDTPAIIVSKSGRYNFRFINLDKGPDVRMYFQQRTYGSFLVGDFPIPTPDDYPRVDYDFVAISATPSCDPDYGHINEIEIFDAISGAG